MLRDPYEAKVVDVRPSSIPGAGMGVFAVKPLSSRTIVGYFNGVHRHRKEVFSSGEDSAYLVEGGLPNEMLDIPKEFTSWRNYQASTGHLINHDDDGNVDYKDCWHPRFGRILCVETVRDLDEGEELFVKYDITVDGDGLKSALKTALSLGQIFSGKSRREFAKEVKPYLKMVSDVVKKVKMKDLIKFS